MNEKRPEGLAAGKEGPAVAANGRERPATVAVREPTSKATRGEEGGSPEAEGVRAAAGTGAEATG